MTWERAIQAEPRLAAIDTMVATQVLYLRPTDTFCAGCYWTDVLKPLVSPLVGWDRRPRRPDSTAVKSFSAETEKWMRSSEAFDVVTDRLLDILEAADPGNGHGFDRSKRSLRPLTQST